MEEELSRFDDIDKEPTIGDLDLFYATRFADDDYNVRQPADNSCKATEPVEPIRDDVMVALTVQESAEKKLGNGRHISQGTRNQK